MSSKNLAHKMMRSYNLLQVSPTRVGTERLATPCAGHLQTRAPLFTLIRKLTKARRYHQRCFKNPSDWLRMVMLGVILLQLAGVAFASNLLDGAALNYIPGTGNMVAGIFSLIILLRIAGPKLYPEWLLEAFLQLVLGSIIASDYMLDDPFSFSAALLALTALTVVRLWIAATILNRRAFSSLAAGAGTTAFLIVWLLASRLTSTSLIPDVMLATDLAIRALSLIMFGLALHSGE